MFGLSIRMKILSSVLIATAHALQEFEDLRIPPLPEREIPKLWDQPEVPKDLLPFFKS